MIESAWGFIADADSPFARMAMIVAAMAALAGLEALVPLRPRTPRGRRHLAPNLALSGLTFASNLLFTAALVAVLTWLQVNDIGLLHHLALPYAARAVLAVLALDLAFYLVHVAMHRHPALWRFHRVHHADAPVDVTTTLRQHPGETVIRYAAIAAFALPLGISAGAFAIYQLLAALSGLLEHANVRLPRRANQALAWVVTFPDMHKVHHSREARLTDSNYGNVVSWWDRLFGTFAPVHNGRAVIYGLDGADDDSMQTVSALLGAPFRAVSAARTTRSAGPPAGNAPPSVSSARESNAAR